MRADPVASDGRLIKQLQIALADLRINWKYDYTKGRLLGEQAAFAMEGGIVSLREGTCWGISNAGADGPWR